MGHGDGSGEGAGEGGGRGRGGDQTTGLLAGSIVACCFLFFMFFIGIPLFIAGVVLVTQANNNFSIHGASYPLRTAGIVCIIISIIFLIIGIILIVLTCCLGSRSGRGQPGQVVQPGGQTTIVTSTVLQGQPGQPQHNVQGYPGVPPGQAYAPQGGYYPQAGYTSGQPYFDPNAPAQPPPYYAAPSAPPPKA